MRKYITADINIQTHRMKTLLGCTWGEAFRVVLEFSDVPTETLKHPASILGSWTYESTRALAGHYWGLAKAYEETADKGRSIAMYATAKKIYSVCETQNWCDLKVLASKGKPSSVVREAFDFFRASQRAELTQRSRELILRGARSYSQHLKIPVWTF